MNFRYKKFNDFSLTVTLPNEVVRMRNFGYLFDIPVYTPFDIDTELIKSFSDFLMESRKFSLNQSGSLNAFIGNERISTNYSTGTYQS